MSFSVTKLSIIAFFGLTIWGTASISLVSAQGTEDWTMFRHNPAHTGRSSLPGPVAPELDWQRETAGFTYASPAVSGNTVYVASQQELAAYDLNGVKLWSFSFPGSQTQSTVDIGGLISSPAVAPNGSVYIGSLNHKLYALDANGNKLWEFDAGDQIFSSPVIGPDGAIYFGSRSKQVFALNPDGTLKWSIITAGEILSSPALGDDGTLYVGSTDERLYAIDSNTGASPWQTPFTVVGEIVSSPAVASDGTVYFGTISNRVYAVNGATGQSKWVAPFITEGEIVSSPAIGADGTVYIGSFDGKLYAINGTNGAQKWSWNPPEPVLPVASSPALDASGHIYIGSLNGRLYSLFDAGNEAIVLWTFLTRAPIWASPAIGTANRIYIAASGTLNTFGRFYAIGQAQYRVAFRGQPVAGQDAEVSILLSSNASLAKGTFFYRSAGKEQFSELPFNGNVTIPSTAVTGRGIEYYIDGPEGTYPAQSPQTRPASQTVLVRNDTAPLDFLPRRYSMISVPYRLDDPSLSAVLGDDYGTYGPLRWRLHRWNGQQFVEYPDIQQNFTPGQAFFLVTADGAAFDIQNGESIDTSLPYTLLLKPGWNQVGNPFGFRIRWNRVVRDPNVVNSIAYFDGFEMIQDPEQIATIDPWEGYFVLNDSDKDVSIQLIPEPSTNEPAGKKPAAARLQIVANLPDKGLSDSQNWIGFDDEALEGMDAMDVREAPPFGEYLRLSIREEDESYALNYKPWADESQSWALELTSSLPQETLSGQPFTLTFIRSSAFPQTAELALVDEDFGYARRIDGDAVTMNWETDLSARRFRIVAGLNRNIEEILADVPIAPDRTTLERNYPNPFHESTTIRYQLHERTAVTITVYNMLGQTVRTLVEAVQSPGSYRVSWEGQDDAGNPVGSGLYIYRLETGRSSATGKMIFVR